MNTFLLNEVPVNLLSERKTKREIIEEYVAQCKQEEQDDHFYVCDIGDIIEKYQQWERLLPRVKLFYAVKCRLDKAMLQVLSDLGASFDCASKIELEQILDLGVSPDRVIYTHTHKPISSLLYAKRQDVSLLAFDSECELRKIKFHHPTARLILRILLLEQFDATDTFGNKFGCPSVETRDLLQLAKELELVVVGISFHVGTGISDPRAYVAALKQSKNAFEIGLELGFKMSVLDIGGGFPGDKSSTDLFKEIANVLNETLDDLFPPVNRVDIIAEPGRYVVSSAYTVVANIIGKRWFPKKPSNREKGNVLEMVSCEKDSKTMMYYVNESSFGSFLVGRMYDPGCITYIPRPIKCVDNKAVSHESVVWGFTGVGNDCVNPSVQLPEQETGDWLYFEDMGAYTQTVSSNFNGLKTPEIKFYCLEDLWYKVYPNKTKKEDE